MANIPAWKGEHATISNTVTSPVVTAQQTRSLDQALKQLDIAVKRTGRIRYQLLNDVLRDIVRLDFPGQNHLLLLLRSCGNLMAETLPAERTKFAQAIWKQFGDLGVSYDDSHYNSLLKVYLQNEHTFSPTEFLAQMEKDGVAPNRVTYQRLLARYCNEGNMDGTSTVLEFMKAQDMPLTEHVFSALIIGHTRAGDMASAINVLSVMKDVGIEPSAETHMVMLCAFAEKGDFESIRQVCCCLISFVYPLIHLRDGCCVKRTVPPSLSGELCELSSRTDLFWPRMSCAFVLLNKVIALMKIFQRMGLPIRQHYFWPMLVLQRKVNDKAGVLYILKTMQELEVPPDMETFVKFVQPAFNSLQEATVEFQVCVCFGFVLTIFFFFKICFMY
uniref:PROP1-like PPR domain-containing protein n=1 Tax=Eptatretus burgeri TaxID=7764 RepID=A0A8C4R7C4_EPTBU